MRKLVIAIVALCLVGCGSGIEVKPDDVNTHLSHIRLENGVVVHIGATAGTGVRIDSLSIQSNANFRVPSPTSFVWMNTTSYDRDIISSSAVPLDDVVFLSMLVQTALNQATIDPVACYSKLIQDKDNAARNNQLRRLLSSIDVQYNAPPSTIGRTIASQIQSWLARTNSSHNQGGPRHPTIQTIWPKGTGSQSDCDKAAVLRSFATTDVFWSAETLPRLPKFTNSRYAESDVSLLSSRITPLVSVRLESEPQPRLVPVWSSIGDVARQVGKRPQYVVRKATAFRPPKFLEDRGLPTAGMNTMQIVFSDSPGYASSTRVLKLRGRNSCQSEDGCDWDEVLVAPGDVIFVDD